MSNHEKKAYVLGTDAAELRRLGFQHQVWSSEALTGWKKAQFGYGDTILDLGSGPGFATQELAYLVGPEGKVIAVDKSQNYLDHLKQIAAHHKLQNIEIINSDFASLELQDASIDHIYHRWALAWMDDVDNIVDNLVSSLKPGGTIVSHEYFDWATLQLAPKIPEWNDVVKAILASFGSMGGNIDIGKELPSMFEAKGMEILNVRSMVKMARPDDLEWNWPHTFFQIYLPKVVEAGFLSHELCDTVLEKFEHARKEGKSILMTPTMIEVIARKL